MAHYEWVVCLVPVTIVLLVVLILVVMVVRRHRFRYASANDPSAQYAPLNGLFAGSREAQDRQRAWVAKGYPLDVVLKGSDIRLRLIPPGSFDMGSPNGEDGRSGKEGPVHRVTISKPFYMAVMPVTQAQWRKVMNGNPSFFKGRDLPVEQVSWDDCQDFIKKLRSSSGATGLRLPTEAEWEYACRAGTTQSRYGEPDAIAWYRDNSGKKTNRVGRKLANGFGLYDILGNVLEWCEDDWHEDYYDAPKDGKAWLGGSTDRVLRGDCWLSAIRNCRSACRSWSRPDYRCSVFGFRVSLGPFAQTSELTEKVAVPAATEPNTPSYLVPVSDAQYAPLKGLFSVSKEAQDRQREWAAKGYPLEVVLKDTDIRFRLIPPGAFMMGSLDTEGEDREEPRHCVTIVKPFYMASTPVTQGQWQKVMSRNPSSFMGNELPVENVGWNDCQDFIGKLRSSSGATGLRLPSEAEWEYACRAGTKGNRYGELDEIGWYDKNSGKGTTPVGRKLANAWGLYDMLGNVYEWCEDNWHDNYHGAPTDGIAWLGVSSRRMLRGGSWCSRSWYCRCTRRIRLVPDISHFTYCGFRPVLDLP